MRKYYRYIILMFIFLSCKAHAQSIDTSYVPYKLVWSCKNERFVSNYKVLRSRNYSTWVTQGTFDPKNSPDSSVYSLQLSRSNLGYFYRIVANMNNGTYYSKIIYLRSTAQ